MTPSITTGANVKWHISDSQFKEKRRMIQLVLSFLMIPLSLRFPLGWI